MTRRSHPCPGIVAAGLFGLLALPLTSCSRDDQAKADEQMDRLSKNAQQVWQQAKPQLQEGAKKAGEVVGKGVEAAGELIQKGGEQMQKDSRDTSQTTLPDTATKPPAGAH